MSLASYFQSASAAGARGGGLARYTDIALVAGIVAIVACSLVLSALFGMNGVWAAFPASEAITACLTLFLLKRKKQTA